MIECTQGSLGTLAYRNHDLLVRHSGDVAGSEHPWQGRFATGIDNDLATRRQLHSAFEPVSVGQQTDLHEDAFQVDGVELTAVAILVGQARDFLTIAFDFAGQRAGNHVNVRQAVELALQHRIGA